MVRNHNPFQKGLIFLRDGRLALRFSHKACFGVESRVLGGTTMPWEALRALWETSKKWPEQIGMVNYAQVYSDMMDFFQVTPTGYHPHSKKNRPGLMKDTLL